MATKTPQPDKPNGEPATVREVELMKVLVSRDGRKVTAQWAIHPQIKKDLLPTEWKEVSELMAQVTGIVGNRFSEILSTSEPDQPGTA
jgi:hypothetical protein